MIFCYIARKLRARKHTIDRFRRRRQIEGRLDRFDERIGRRESQLREEFARVQELIAGFQSQQSFLAGFGF